MKRRTLILGGAATAVAGAVVGCTSGPVYDASEAESLYPPIGRFVVVNGQRVHYWEAGQGQPLILVHGASGNLRDWTFDVAPELAKTHRVIAFDRPGFGYTERGGERGWDPAVQARTLYAASRQLGVEQPIVVGHSWGGALALSWALQYPDETAGIIPVSGVTMPYKGVAQVFGALGLDTVVVNAYSAYMQRVAARGGIDSFIARVFRPLEPPEGYLDYVGAPLALREKTVAANSEDLQHVNEALLRMAPDHPSLKPKVEIIHGREDFIDASHHAVPLANRVPGAGLTILPGVGHMAHHANIEAIRAASERIVA
ncbi:alpha/beta hydrolase [Rhodobacteraceae bacterium NNCM2]|nr:alpha/beta hydrolase [Coraliihabitans acroporae]